jgi:hypothetical protein
VDSAGESYWEYLGFSTSLRIADLRDLDGDGRKEVVVQDGSSVVARKATAGNLWKTPPLGAVRSVVPDPLGGFLVQTSDGMRSLDREGRVVGTPAGPAGRGVLKGRIVRSGGSTLDLFGPRYGPQVELPDNLLGDGEKEILVMGGQTLAVFSTEAKPALILKFPNALMEPVAALGDIDGRPGDELLLAIPGYGLVALGASADARPITAQDVAVRVGRDPGFPSRRRLRRHDPGVPLLILRVHNSQVAPLAALENQDGRPGDELIVMIANYGLVAMGIQLSAP